MFMKTYDDARERGCVVLQPVAVDPTRAARERLFPPAIVLEPPADARLMREEIFGPILPVRSYARLDDALAFAAALPRPLALYPFTRDRATLAHVVERVPAGGVTANDALLHFSVRDLPFGGIGPSGMGAIHGKAGFDTFSHALPVLWQPVRAASDFLRPPYRGRVDRLVRFLAK